jgi:ABC-type branched-subunit amino acid transport system substrate-binding protein
LLLAKFWRDGIQTPVYLSMEAAQRGSGLRFAPPDSPGKNTSPDGGIWTISSTQTGNTLEESFIRRFEVLTGSIPSPIAAEAYDAVRLIIRALRETGPNRARVRDQVAGVRNNPGASGPISFDQEGNNRQTVRLVRMVVDDRPSAKQF